MVELIRRVAPWQSGGWVLDLACGAGRHAKYLVRGGARVIGYDLSRVLLRRAISMVGIPVARGDIRSLPFASDTFTLVVNLFTSFGYFASDELHQRVLREVARVLEPGGRFVLDFLHAAHVRATLVPHDTLHVGSREVLVERSISDDGLYIVKEMHFTDEGRSFIERVRLYDPSTLRQMFADAGLTVTDAFAPK